MATKFDWNGKKFTLKSEFSPKKLFWGTDTVLSMDGVQLLKASGSGFVANDETTVTNDDGESQHIHLHVHAKATNLGYSVRVDGEEISAGTINQENVLIAIPFFLLQGFIGVALILKFFF